MRERPARVGEQDLLSEPREQLEQLVRVPRLVEQVGAEDEVRTALHGAPARARPSARTRREDAMPLRSAFARKQRDGVVCPVGREDVGAPERCRERGQPEAGAELEHAHGREVERRRRARERDPARPELRPVRQELVIVERRLVDQLVRARRAGAASASRPASSTVSSTGSVCIAGSVTEMRYRQLGSSDLQVSEISLGSWLTYGGGVERRPGGGLRRQGVRGRDQLHRHGERVCRRQGGGVPRRGARRPSARLVHPRDEALRPDERRRTAASRASRCSSRSTLARAAAHRLRRSLPVPPLRLGHAARGDDGGADRGRAPGKARYLGFSEWPADKIEEALDAAGRREVRLEPAAVLDALARARATT